MRNKVIMMYCGEEEKLDNFKEQLVRVEDLTLYNVARIVTVILAAIGVLAMMNLGVIMGLVIFAIAAVAFYFKRFLYIEYEYSITNGEIDIDAIYEMNSRKKQASFNMKEVALLADVNSSYYKDFSNKPTKVINCVPKGNKDKVYAALVTEGNKRIEVQFVPNKEFIDICFLYNPKAVKK
jgi:hypothetical protein